MTLNITLGYRLELGGNLERKRLEGISSNETIEKLRKHACAELHIQDSDSVDFIYCGRVMKNEDILSHYGVINGSMIHVLPRRHRDAEQEEKVETRPFDDAEVQRIIFALRTATLKQGFMKTLQKLTQPDSLVSILAATPGLAHDPIAKAALRDPDLLIHLADPKCVQKVWEKHPSLLEAANIIAASMHEDSSVPFHPAFMQEYLEDDPDPDTSQSESPSRDRGFQPITASQLASALEAVGNFLPSRSTGSSPSPRGGPSTSSSSSNLFTPEMLNQAMQEALSASASSQGGSGVGSSEMETGQSERVAQMRELGIHDEELCLRALQATDGDVQAAVELIFNQWAEN